MPQHKSARKRVKTSLRRQVRNRAARSTLRTAIKAIQGTPADQADEAARRMYSLVDRAARHGLIHKNKAARLKSRFKPTG